MTTVSTFSRQSTTPVRIARSMSMETMHLVGVGKVGRALLRQLSRESAGVRLVAASDTRGSRALPELRPPDGIHRQALYRM